MLPVRHYTLGNKERTTYTRVCTKVLDSVQSMDSDQNYTHPPLKSLYGGMRLSEVHGNQQGEGQRRRGCQQLQWETPVKCSDHSERRGLCIVWTDYHSILHYSLPPTRKTPRVIKGQRGENERWCGGGRGGGALHIVSIYGGLVYSQSSSLSSSALRASLGLLGARLGMPELAPTTS